MHKNSQKYAMNPDMKPNKAPVPKNTHKKLPLNSRPNCERAPEEEMNSRKQKEIEDVNLNEYQ